MYNRYIPQPDGSFRRNRIPQTPPPAPPVAPCPPPEPPCAPPEPPCPPPKPQQRPPQGRPQKPPEHSGDGSIGGFLKKLLPKDFDTGDLMIILLLLLMAGDSHEDQNTALLTLALYLFM